MATLIGRFFFICDTGCPPGNFHATATTDRAFSFVISMERSAASRSYLHFRGWGAYRRIWMGSAWYAWRGSFCGKGS